MKKTLLILLACLVATTTYAGSVLIEGFEYGNHDLSVPIGWSSPGNAWLSGNLEKDHNRIPHTGNWYAFTETDDESWMFMSLNLITVMKYRFTCWAITDGDYALEIWAGAGARPEEMTTQMLSATVGSGQYDKFSSYIENIPANCNYIGIKATALNGGGCLTIDDLQVDMVEQYSFEVHELAGDTVMHLGTTASFPIMVQNTGYDPLDIYMYETTDFFTDVHFEHNGSTSTTFHTEPNETVIVTVTATLKPDVELGSLCWIDIHFTLSCDCATGMATFWVTPVDATHSVDEDTPQAEVYPNPATDFVTIEADGLQSVQVFDMTGKALSSVAAKGNSIRLDVSDLPTGTYLISAKTRSTSSFVKSILKM